ncbi:MAG TPA: FAD-dependent monooxygenase [Jatrophihabitantaceae bacterium]|nr:FAD-dependent monooxygenase [Jatrophihabitantaceae bacterium]
MTESEYDAVVVGARPAGAATALLLARAGLRVLVVDRSARGADTLSTHALMRTGVLQLSRWQVLDRVVDAGTPPVRSATFHLGPEPITIPIEPTDGIDALYAPRRTVLDPILADAAAAAGAELRYGVAVIGLCRDRTGRVTGIVGRDAAGNAFTARARITVGADGMGSRVAQWVDASIERAGAAASGVVYGYWTGLPLDGYHWYFRPGAAAGAIPTNHGQTCVFVSTTRQGLRDAVRDDLATGFGRMLGAAAPELVDLIGASAPVGPLHRFSGRAGHLRRAAGPGWALVGDAGYFKDPISAHGLTDALRDAELLARAIIAASAGDEAALLAGYQAIRDRLSMPLFGVTNAIASYSWDTPTISSLLRQLSAAMAGELGEVRGFDDMPASAMCLAAS